jgi:hypothetical protein
VLLLESLKLGPKGILCQLRQRKPSGVTSQKNGRITSFIEEPGGQVEGGSYSWGIVFARELQSLVPIFKAALHKTSYVFGTFGVFDHIPGKVESQQRLPRPFRNDHTLGIRQGFVERHKAYPSDEPEGHFRVLGDDGRWALL